MLNRLERLLFISPYLHDTTRGNAVQAWRKIRQLESAGVQVLSVDLSKAESSARLAEQAKAFSPQ